MAAGVPARIRWLFAGLLVASAALTLWAARGASFTADEWSYLLRSVHATPDTVLGPVAGHLTALLLLSYHALFATVGLGHSWPYRAVSTATHLLCCILLFAYARRRVGDLGGLLATVPILFLGTGADTFLTLYQAAPVGSLTAGIAALLALDRRRRRWDLFACVMLVLAVAGDSEGVILAGAILLEILLTRGARHRAWVPLVPLALFIAWALRYHPTQSQPLARTSTLSDLFDRARYVFNAAASAVAGLAGVQLSSPSLHRRVPLGRLAAHVLLIAGVAAVLVRVARRGATPRIVTFIVTLVGYWTVLAVARGSTSNGYDNRYVFVGALLIVLLVVELLRGTELRGRRLRVVTLAVAVCAALNVVWLLADGRFKRHEGALVRAELSALEISRGQVPADFQPDNDIRLQNVRAGGYFAATSKYGSSPADSLAGLSAAPEYTRSAADSVLVRALGVAVTPLGGTQPPSAGPPVVELVRGGSVRTVGGCLEFTPSAPAAVLGVRLPAGGAIIRPPPGTDIAVWVRRFGPFPTQSLAVVRERAALLRAPLGRATAPWHALVLSSRRTTVCG